MSIDDAIKLMIDEIMLHLSDSRPTIYLFGSVVRNDFKLGWSDIDFIALTESELTTSQANSLVELRQRMQKRYPNNPYFRLFEGGILSADAFLNNKNECAVYWGTSGQRITNNFKLDSFGIAELLDNGILLCGNDLRSKMSYPTYEQMRDDIANHMQIAKQYGKTVGWLLDIARGIFTIRTGKIISKTAAGEWALKNSLCYDEEAMSRAIHIRKEPLKFLHEERNIDTCIIQGFADVLDTELQVDRKF